MLLTRSLIARSSPLSCLCRNSCRRFSRLAANQNEPENDDLESRSKPPVFFGDSAARGVGQVIFLNAPASGVAVLGSLALGDPYLAGLAAVGTISATAAASASGLDTDALQSGLYGYNGCLVGCATAVFIAPFPQFWISGLVTTVVAGAATPFVVAALKPAMGSVPQWTLGFNFVTLTMLLRLKPFSVPVDDANAVPSPVVDVSLIDLALSAPLKGVSQIFVVESNYTGVALLGSIALYSPGLAAHTFMGASIGALTGITCCGATVDEVSIGLWGFNSALTSLGCGVFFVHSPATVALSAGGAAAASALFGAFKTVFGAFDAPCLTLPFCVAMSGCYLLAPSLVQLAKDPHSPEENE